MGTICAFMEPFDQQWLMIRFRSNPLPPITRLEEKSQIKRCARLRRAIHRTLISMFSPYYRFYQTLKSFAATLDLEKYYDIYEISRTDLEDAELVANVEPDEIEDADTLHDLKVGLQKLHLLRKLLLCTLLALDADGSRLDYRRWSVAVEMMCAFNSVTVRMTSHIDEVMREEEGKPGYFYLVMLGIDQTIVRLSHSADSKGTFDSQWRTYAKSDATIRQPVSRYPWPPGEDVATPG